MSALLGSLETFKHEIRIDLERHADNDDRRFRDINDRLDSVTASIQKINVELAEWTGAMHVAKWMLNLGIPAILGLLVAILLRKV